MVSDTIVKGIRQFSFIRCCLFVLVLSSIFLPKIQAQDLEGLLKSTERDTAWVKAVFEKIEYRINRGLPTNRDSLLLVSEQLKRESVRLNFEWGQYQSYYIKAMSFRSSARDSVIFYLKRGQSVITNPNSLLAAQANLRLSQQFQFFRQEDSARVYAQKSLRIASELGKLRTVALSHDVLGLIYRRAGKLPKALYHCRQALRNYEELGDRLSMAYALRTISLNYDYLKDYDKAYEVMNQSIRLRQELSKESGKPYAMEITTQNNLGRLLIQLGQYDQAIDTLRSLIRRLEPQPIRFIRFPRYNLGNAYLKTGELDSSLYYLQLAVDQAEQLDDNFVRSLAYYDIGLIYQKRNEKNKAFGSFRRAYLAAKNRGVYSAELISATYALSSAYEDRGDMDNALRYYKIWNEAKDSLFNAEKATQMALQDANYQFDKERDEMEASQERERLALQADLRRKVLVQRAAVVIVVITLAFMIYVFMALQKKKKANKLISEQNLQISQAADELEKLSNFKEGLTNMIAHDMKNSLSTIINVSHEDKVLDKKKVERIRQAGGNVLNLVTTMLDVQKFEEAKFQLNRERSYISFIFNYAHEQVMSLLQGKSLQLVIQGNETVALEVDQEVMGRVMVNLLVNAIKFSDNGKQIKMEAGLDLNSQTPEMIVSVIDTGTGIAASDLPYIFDKFRQAEARSSGRVASTGLGLTFCKLAIEAHGGRIWVESEPGKGTRVSLSIPVLDNSVKINGAESGPLSMVGATARSIDMEESLILKKYAVRMQAMGVHEIKKLRTVLNELEEENPDSEWSSDLWSAILQGNKERYQYLLNKVLNEEVST